MKYLRMLIVGVLSCMAVLSGGSLSLAHVAAIAPNAPMESPQFGSAVALDGDTALVGAMYGPSDYGAGYIFHRDHNGTDAWGGLKQVSSTLSNLFDCHVAVSGDIAAVIGGSANRTLYILYRNQGGSDNWGQVQAIHRDDLLLTDVVAINGDTIVVGAWDTTIGGNNYQGTAYVFQRNQGGPDNWGQVKQLTAADGAAYAEFGSSVAISGDIVVVGAHDASISGRENQGAVYVFYRNQGGANNWGQVKKITAADGAANSFFGERVSLYTDRLVVGAPLTDVNGKVDQGAAYVFYRNWGGNDNWGQVKKLLATDGVAQDFLGEVSIYQETIAVGASGADVGGHASQGAAYIFYRNQGGSDNWGQVRKITASDGGSGDNFSFGALQVNGTTLLVGASHTNGGQGAAYVFYRDQGGVNNWGPVKKIVMPDVTPPTNPASLTSSSHGVNVWSNDNTVSVQWISATDQESGVDGYSILWDQVASTIPAASKTVEEATLSSTSPALSDGSWYFHIRTVDNAGNWATGALHIGPFMIDTSAPTSSASASEFAIGPFEVRWNGSDSGSGLANYDVWVRDGLGGSWTQWQSGTSATSAIYADILAGHTYYFRSQAHDIAGNVETDLPIDGDTHTTSAAYQATGRVVNNRAEPIFNALVSADPAALNTAKSSGEGTHVLYFGSSGTYTLTATRAEFGTLPPRYGIALNSNLTGLDFVLPPMQNGISNGDFETGDLSGWSIGDGLTTTINITATHTGYYGARLESSGSGGLDFEPSITQPVVISAEWSRPTLAWLYQGEQANPGDVVLVVVSTESTSITATIPITIGAWQHNWLDLSAFSGQTVRVQFGFQTQAAGQQIELDEVSVGESQTGVYAIFLPLNRRSP